MISNMLSFHKSQTIHYISDHFSFFISSRIGQHVGLGKRAGKPTNTELSCKNKDRPKKEASDGLLSCSSSIPVSLVSVNAGSTSSHLLSPPFPLCKCCLAASASVENKEQDMDTFSSSTQYFHSEHSSLSKVQPLGARVKTDNKKICKCGLFPLCVCQKHAYFHVCMI